MRRPRAVGAALTLALALVAGCSSTVDGAGSASAPPAATSQPASSAPPSSSAPPALDETKIDPCSLVTKAEADQVAGVTTMAPVRALTLCTFATPTSGKLGQFEIIIGDGAKKELDIDRDELKHAFTTVTGVGDEAYLESGALFLRVRTLWVFLRVVRLDSVDTGPLLEDVGRHVAGRL